MISEEIRSLVLRKAPTSEIRRTAMDQRDGHAARGRLGQGAGGSTTVEEILRVTQED